MELILRPATQGRFRDVATVLAPKNPDPASCWCPTYPLSSRENRELTARERPRTVERLCTEPIPPGILGYDGHEVVGWCGVAPRAQLHAFTHGTRIPRVDDLPLWGVWCFRVRAGHRGRGVAQGLLQGAVQHGAQVGTTCRVIF